MRAGPGIPLASFSDVRWMIVAGICAPLQPLPAGRSRGDARRRDQHSLWPLLANCKQADTHLFVWRFARVGMPSRLHPPENPVFQDPVTVAIHRGESLQDSECRRPGDPTRFVLRVRWMIVERFAISRPVHAADTSLPAAALFQWLPARYRDLDGGRRDDPAFVRRSAGVGKSARLRPTGTPYY